MDELRAAVETTTRTRGAQTRVPRRALLTFIGLAAATLAAGCGRPEPLADTFESDDAVVRAVLDAVSRNDGEALLRMTVTKDEFQHVVWPTLMVSRPEVGMPMDYVWNDTSTKSRGFLSETLAAHGGKRYELLEIAFLGDTTYHSGYQISRKSHLRVRDANGEEQTIRLFGSMIRQNGRSKVYSFIID